MILCGRNGWRGSRWRLLARFSFLGRRERVEKDSILPSLGHVAAGAECIRSHDHQRRTRSANLQINDSIVGAACTCWGGSWNYLLPAPYSTFGHHFISSSASSFIYLRAGSAGFSLRIGRALAYASLRCISRINLGPGAVVNEELQALSLLCVGPCVLPPAGEPSLKKPLKPLLLGSFFINSNGIREQGLAGG
jgi:hypothetical protein